MILISFKTEEILVLNIYYNHFFKNNPQTLQKSTGQLQLATKKSYLHTEVNNKDRIVKKHNK